MDILPEKEWQPDKDLRVETAFLPSIWNCFDESALAMALRLHKENEDISLSALTIAPPAGETAMRTLYALGFDNCARLDPGGADGDPEERKRRGGRGGEEEEEEDAECR